VLYKRLRSLSGPPFYFRTWFWDCSPLTTVYSPSTGRRCRRNPERKETRARAPSQPGKAAPGAPNAPRLGSDPVQDRNVDFVKAWWKMPQVSAFPGRHEAQTGNRMLNGTAHAACRSRHLDRLQTVQPARHGCGIRIRHVVVPTGLELACLYPAVTPRGRRCGNVGAPGGILLTLR
jgi:hypothetical protein